MPREGVATLRQRGEPLPAHEDEPGEDPDQVVGGGPGEGPSEDACPERVASRRFRCDHILLSQNLDARQPVAPRSTDRASTCHVGNGWRESMTSVNAEIGRAHV